MESTDFRSILKISGAKSKVRLEKWQYCIKVPLEKCRNYLEVHLEKCNLFTEDYDMERIILAIGAITSVPIIAGKTLIILDEIQELKNGLTALKYFCEQASQHHVAVAGSLLGITMHHGESAPVGKVDILNM